MLNGNVIWVKAEMFVNINHVACPNIMPFFSPLKIPLEELTVCQFKHAQEYTIWVRIKKKSLTTEYILYNVCVNRTFSSFRLTSGVYSYKCVSTLWKWGVLAKLNC